MLTTVRKELEDVNAQIACHRADGSDGHRRPERSTPGFPCADPSVCTRCGPYVDRRNTLQRQLTELVAQEKEVAQTSLRGKEVAIREERENLLIWLLNQLATIIEERERLALLDLGNTEIGGSEEPAMGPSFRPLAMLTFLNSSYNDIGSIGGAETQNIGEPLRYIYTLPSERLPFESRMRRVNEEPKAPQ